MIICVSTWWHYTFIRWLMVFLTSFIDGLWLGSLSQQRVIRVTMGSGRSLIRGGRVPVIGNSQLDDNSFYGDH